MIETRDTTGFYPEEDESAGWLVTYGDLVTLLLVFFVLLYSISSLNFEKFKHAIKSIQTSLGETSPRVGLMDLVNVPVSTLQFPSNWELSAVRATTVLKHMISRNVDPYRLTATGYGEILPMVPNDSPENRSANRRVEFVLEKK